MWPFKPRKRFVIMEISSGHYYAGSAGMHEGVLRWAMDEENAQRFDRASADSVAKAMIIDRMSGSGRFGPTAVIEL